MEAQPNLLAVLAAGLLPMVIGALWYGPLFGKKWMALMEVTKEDLQKGFNPIKTYGVNVILFLVAAYVLAHVLDAWRAAYDVDGLVAGMQGAFWCWLGFTLVVAWQTVAFEGRKTGLFLINIGYNLVALLCMGALLGVWR